MYEGVRSRGRSGHDVDLTNVRFYFIIIITIFFSGSSHLRGTVTVFTLYLNPHINPICSPKQHELPQTFFDIAPTVHEPKVRAK